MKVTQIGPFDMPADLVDGLKERFTAFVNQLLDVERAGQGLAGHSLSITLQESRPDGGVDAALRGALGTDWLPAGDSAWQFKRSGLAPAACANELEGASWAHQYLRSGGSYILAMGTPLPDNLIEARRAKVAAKAIELGLIAEDDHDRIRIYDANKLARWASTYPSLVVSRVAGGPGGDLVDYARWRASGAQHKLGWRRPA